MDTLLRVLRLNVFRSWKTTLAGLGLVLVALFGAELAPDDARTVSESAARVLEIAGAAMVLWREKEHRTAGGE